MTATNLRRWCRGVAIMPGIVVQQAKSRAKRPLEHALAWLNRRPRLKSAMSLALFVLPPLRRRLIAFSARRKREQQVIALVIPTWTLKPGRDAMAAWRALLGSGDGRPR